MFFGHTVPCFANSSLQVEEFYTPGSLELLQARRKIAEYSLPRLYSSPTLVSAKVLMDCMCFALTELKSGLQYSEQTAECLSGGF
jgi:hypothetical protein